MIATAIACLPALGISTAWAQTSMIAEELVSIQEERASLTESLAQIEQTLKIVMPQGAAPEESTNPEVKSLVTETMHIREQLITITEREIALLQQKIATNASAPETQLDGPQQVEGKPLPPPAPNYSTEDEAEDVVRLLTLLTQYHSDLQDTLRTLPTEEEMAQRDAARQDAAGLSKIPFSADKIRLNSAEGSTALAEFSQRLSDESIPESRRDIRPICGIKTHLVGTLIASENRSLTPVGKNQYISRVRFQPGDTTLRINSHKWELRLPQTISAQDYILTLYVPKAGKPELHIFAVDDLLAQESPYIPAWMPDELNLKPRAG